jgi:mono/diheme cytochrome c family protein
MKTRIALLGILCLSTLFYGCARNVVSAATPAIYGSALVEVSGGKQAAPVGSRLEQPVVVQVNDDQGNGVSGAWVTFRATEGFEFDPVSGPTDTSGQFTTNVTVEGMAGRYQLTASIITKTQKTVTLKIEEIALGYQEVLGRELNEQYCSRCHNPESTPQRVSNYDNLETKPHAFTEGDALNKLGDADLLAIIDHGGPALNRSPLMPPYGYTLSKSDIQALVAYIRMVSDPPYRSAGVSYSAK